MVTASQVESAVEALRGGGVVLVPTDTVYGLAVDPTVPGAIGRLFDLKGRDRDTPIAVLVADAAQAWSVARHPVDRFALDLAERFWPGALTVVVQRSAQWEVDLGGDPGTVGLRCPDHELVRRMCRAVGPLATTSANRHGNPPAATVEEAVAALGPIEVVIDGGPIAGQASTVVDCTGLEPRILRVGAIRAEEVFG